MKIIEIILFILNNIFHIDLYFVSNNNSTYNYIILKIIQHNLLEYAIYYIYVKYNYIILI